MISKNGFNKDVKVFEEMMMKGLKCDIVANTSRRQRSPDSVVDNHFIKNNFKVNFKDKIVWKNYNDHSKWMFCADNNYVCFGDLNHMKS